jgi:hypothetical protein
MTEDSEYLINKLISIFNVETQVELSEALGIDQTHLSRWKRKGFPKGTGSIIKHLIKRCEKNKQ